MEAYIEFIKELGCTTQPIQNIQEQNKSYFDIPPFIQQLQKNIREEPVRLGVFLGQEHKKKFTPSIALLSHIAPHTEQKIWLNERSSWLFICGRDIFKENIERNNDPAAKKVIVLNSKDEILGCAQHKNDQYNNIVDIGMFQRRKR